MAERSGEEGEEEEEEEEEEGRIGGAGRLLSEEGEEWTNSKTEGVFPPSSREVGRGGCRGDHGAAGAEEGNERR